MKKAQFIFVITLIGFLVFINGCEKNSADKDDETTVTDKDGNVYNTIKIGDQIWMAENLEVTHYRNGDEIPEFSTCTDWCNRTTGAYCDHALNNDDTIRYGRLYNWYAVDDSRKLAPEGWHIPGSDEWQTLIDYLGGKSVAGGKLKEKGTAHWRSPNTGATDEIGFTALPSGALTCAVYVGFGTQANFWTSTEDSIKSDFAWSRYMGYYYKNINSESYNKLLGYSVRCVKD